MAREHGDAVAAEACSAEHANAHCQERAAFCPLYRLMAEWSRWSIPEREKRLLRDDLLGTKPLSPRLALRAMKARLAGITGPEGVKGTEALIMLGGKVGVGKTVAATWALSRRGGRYVTAGEFAGIGLDIAEIKRVNVLVIDQLGTEPIGGSEWSLGKFLDVVDSRYANLRLTVLCTNMLREELEPRYSKILTRRLNDDGIFIRLVDAL